MKKILIVKSLASPILIYLIFILCTAIAMLISPDAFHKFFSPYQLFRAVPPLAPQASYYWDIEHYANKALQDNCNAFYPLWSWLIRIIFNPQSVDEAANYFKLISTGILFVSAPFSFYVFKYSLNKNYLAFLVCLAYVLNPMAIFRVIGYTESIFAFFSFVFIWLCIKQNNYLFNIKIVGIVILTALMSLTRPSLIQLGFSSLAAIATISILEIIKLGTINSQNIFSIFHKYSQEIKITVAVWVGAVIGYSFYGMFCLQTRGNFLAPFQDQKDFGKKLGLHLELLFLPRSMLFDLLGLYFPVIILVVSILFVYLKIKHNKYTFLFPKSNLWNISLLYPPLWIGSYCYKVFIKNDKNKGVKFSTYDFTYSLSENYIFWFCVYFPFIHSVIVFFTQDRLASLGRYVFGLPFLFVALGYLCRCISTKKIYQTMYWLIVISAISLVEQWIRYGQDKWLG